MPPSSGMSAANWITARPCGTKNSAAASAHRVKELGPAFAAVATHEIPRIATRLNKTKSRKLSWRSSDGSRWDSWGEERVEFRIERQTPIRYRAQLEPSEASEVKRGVAH